MGGGIRGEGNCVVSRNSTWLGPRVDHWHLVSSASGGISPSRPVILSCKVRFGVARSARRSMAKQSFAVGLRASRSDGIDQHLCSRKWVIATKCSSCVTRVSDWQFRASLEPGTVRSFGNVPTARITRWARIRNEGPSPGVPDRRPPGVAKRQLGGAGRTGAGAQGSSDGERGCVHAGRGAGAVAMTAREPKATTHVSHLGSGEAAPCRQQSGSSLAP